MATVTKKFHSDAGHGWLAVKIHELKMLGIETEISEYSYVRGGTAYLEEDCDAPKFINAMQVKGIEVMVDEGPSRDRSPIRSMASYDSASI